jgi:aminopeptidase YwaD
MKTTILKIVLLFLLFTTAISAQNFIQAYADVVNKTSQANVTNDLKEFEALGVKRRGTTQLNNALTWLKNKYTSYGYATSQIVEDSYTYSGSTAVCKNLIVTKIGTRYPNKFVIVCGHYDSITGTGTNDNGSGTACILEMARLLKNIPTEYSIKFINFSGEEDGLFGSQHYVSAVVNGTTPKMDIKLVFNLDEVGGDAAKINNTITCERDTDATPSTNNAQSNIYTNELIKCVGLYSPLRTLLSYAYASDYVPFQSNNEIITGFFETNETPHKHTATDLLVNMDPVYNYNVAKAALGAVMHFAVATSTLGIDDYNENFQVGFFPNPTHDFLTIDLGNLSEKECQFSLIDINGRIVLEKNLINTSNMNNINISGYNKGMYLALLEAGDKKISKKIVIE